MAGFEAASSGGTGSRLTRITIVLAGVASLVATLLSFLSIWLQTKNYRKPLLQRYVVRILLMVPIYSASSWASIVSLKAAFWLDPIRDIYEAFTIYTFFQLLINYIGGERSLIIMMHGRRPVHHPWPLDQCFAAVDISDPHTFLAIKRGILQYAWLKPILSAATLILKSTNTYQEGYLGLSSGYLWVGILYNISVTLSLYSLAMFWVCMSQDLKPFRPVPKFLCIKLIIFASYWQGFFLSILQFLGAIPNNVEGYTADNLAAAIQDALICFEMPAFAVAHWYAFSWHDYADVTISAARMPVKYALRDAFGIRDLIEDTRETFAGRHYEYRIFDSGDNVIAHAESGSRVARMMEGMRYERGGKGKYWLPKPHDVNSRTPLLSGPGPSRAAGISQSKNRGSTDNYGPSDIEAETSLDQEDERLYSNARALEFGDWNYPVVTAHHATRERWMREEPEQLTTATNRNLLQPTKDNQKRRESEVRDAVHKGKRRGSSTSGSKSRDRHQEAIAARLPNQTGRSESSHSGRSQLVDLVVEDTKLEEAERVRARKEGGPGWNEEEPRHFVRTYSFGGTTEGEDIREGFEPGVVPADTPEFVIEEDEPDGEAGLVTPPAGSSGYGALDEEGNPWGSPGTHR